MAGSSRSRRSYDDRPSESETDDTASGEYSPDRSSRKRSKDRSHRSKSKTSRHNRSRSRRGRNSNDESSGEDSDGIARDSSKRKRSSRNITEEEIAEYMAKKAQKKAMRAAKKLKAQTVSGYSNDSNPFGDSNLNEKFVWRKKIERDVSQGVPLDAFSVKAEKKRQKERMAEIEKVKKRREERALEKAQHEEEMAMLARERARAEFDDWEKKEEEFHFDQSKVRSEIRLREGRMKPIDVLSKHLNGSDDMDIELNEPYMVFKGLTVKEMEELRDDIKMHLDLDRATLTHIVYWEALMVVCDWELAEARKKDAVDRARVRGEEPPAELLAEERGLHSSIEEDVKNQLEGKTHSELEVLQSQIESQMRTGTAKVVEYWEAVLKRLHIFKAKACLKEIHAKMLRKHLQRLEQPSEGEDRLESDSGLRPVEEASDHDVKDAETSSPEPIIQEETHDVEEEAGSFSPELLHGDEDEEAIDPEEDRALLERKRMAWLEEQRKRLQEALASKPAPSEDNFELKAMKAMGAMEEGDAVFGSGAEVNLDSQVYWWHDKYRPRKPKYFNRVHTGYEWNKYNQTHYDHDNPPPKIVQGYKFNIFYPDLVDKTKAPAYTIEKDGNSSETCIIRFHAGPPYEDIAFRIVNKEWEYSHKKGFKCTFERGILHVYFNFKRYRYRRSYLEMEKQLKIYVYEEGELPLFHDGPCRLLYTMEGQLINKMEVNKRFRTHNPHQAHLFYLPYSITRLVQYNRVKGTPMNNLGAIVLDYVNLVATKHTFWNRSLGSDHFMLSCHDWTRALCNANTSERFNPTKDVWVPEISLKSDRLEGLIGRPSPSKRSILAFFAGGNHGFVRPILFKHWEKKDPDIQVHSYLRRGVSYNDLMRQSKYCLCPSGSPELWRHCTMGVSRC
ncbi:hypothetical protein V6N12_035634 [Hibiscus sabdariffa]|uniref:Splicing factor Cactin n=1 Tax=Hibiscus sabdariffa TaxID=183260 RepID=A0ABR2ENB6_9ROSI